MEKMAKEYAPMSIKPAWPREKSPVKPLSRFMDTQTSAKMALFFSTGINITVTELVGMALSSRKRNT